MVVLEGQKRIEAGATVVGARPRPRDLPAAGPLRYGRHALPGDHAHRCAIFFFDDAFLGEFAHQHSLLLDGRMAADPVPAGAARARVAATRASIESVLPYFTHDGANRPRILRLKLQEIR